MLHYRGAQSASVTMEAPKLESAPCPSTAAKSQAWVGTPALKTLFSHFVLLSYLLLPLQTFLLAQTPFLQDMNLCRYRRQEQIL